jgi:hypothetical protein
VLELLLRGALFEDPGVGQEGRCQLPVEALLRLVLVAARRPQGEPPAGGPQQPDDGQQDEGEAGIEGAALPAAPPNRHRPGR